jgi:predicted flap endonuclease-1-like 5' DNA nuclease
MTNFGCWWWWLLLGGLLGWLASWWLGRRSQQTVTVERVVEKIVDRPVQVVVEKVVEKVVDRPVDRPVDRIVDRIVERLVETPVDNPLHINRIRVLEAQVAQMTALQATPAALMAATIAPAAASTPASVVPAAAPAPEAAPAKAVSKIMDRALDRLLDRQAAVSAGFSVRGMDDLEIIEGIGPKIAGLFKAEGIRMFWELAQTPQLRMQAILDRAGPNFRMANPSTWAKQSDLAANNQWDALRKLQDELSAGVDKTSKGEL